MRLGDSVEIEVRPLDAGLQGDGPVREPLDPRVPVARCIPRIRWAGAAFLIASRPERDGIVLWVASLGDVRS